MVQHLRATSLQAEYLSHHIFTGAQRPRTGHGFYGSIGTRISAYNTVPYYMCVHSLLK